MKRKRTALIAVLALVSVILVAVPLFTVQADLGTNWTGTFYNNSEFLGFGTNVTGINGLNFDWGVDRPYINDVKVPISGCPNSPTCSDNFSVRFTSTQNLIPGQYSFVVSSDDGVRFYVNGVLILDKWIVRNLTSNTVSVGITSSPVNLTVEYFEGVGRAFLQVVWFRGAPGSTPTFPPTTPTRSAPVRNTSLEHTILLSWNAVSWAVGYRIQVATDKLFKQVVWDDDTLSSNTLSVNTPNLNNGVYYWRVRAKTNATTWGSWSITDIFTINAYEYGTNWRGIFYPIDLNPSGVTIDNIQGLNFDWGTGVPMIDGVAVPTIPSDRFRVEFFSGQTFSGGTYTFFVTSDDGVRVYIDNELILDKYEVRTLTQDVFNVTLKAGLHGLYVEYFEDTGQASLQVRWLYDN